MAILVAVVFAVVIIGLVTAIVSLWPPRARPTPRARSLPPERHRPNVAFWVLGVLAILGGLALIVVGALAVADAAQKPNAFKPAGAEAQADGASTFVWGVMVLTCGAYVVRGARRRGARDRWGRVQIVLGYLVLGLALSLAIHRAVDLWDANTEDEHRNVMLQTMGWFLLFGIPGAWLIHRGVENADEEVITTAGMNADF
jgi:hypothetical protein